MTRLYGVHAPMCIGVVLMPAGFFGASFATKVWHLYLSQGLAVGLGIGLIYIPATAVISQWFSHKRSFANGICAAGSGVGGLVIIFFTQKALDDLGVAWSLRITAIVTLVVNSVATLLVRSRNKQIQPDLRMFNVRILRSYHARLLLGWSFTIMFGYINLMFSLSDYAQIIGRSANDAAVVQALLNLGTAIGRPAINYASDHWGRIEVAGLSTVLCAVLIFGLWASTTTYAALLVFSILSGAVLGIFWVVRAPVYLCNSEPLVKL